MEDWECKEKKSLLSPILRLPEGPFAGGTAIETVLQAGLNYLLRHKMNSLPGQPIKTAWASSFNA